MTCSKMLSKHDCGKFDRFIKNALLTESRKPATRFKQTNNPDTIWE